jgi:signal transduction histidine kinase/CheY-like chemotaxis protein
MMTKDGITTFATRPGLEIDPELRLSLTWVIAVLVCVGSAVTFMGELLVEPVQRLSQIPLVCFGLAMLIWWLDRFGGTRLSRWFTLIGLSILINLAFIRFGISDLYLLMILLPLLALALMTWTAALLTALLETIGLLFLWPTIGIDPIFLVLTIGLIWTVLGLQLAIIGPQVRRSQWSYDQFHRAQQRLDETRDQKVQLAQMQEDLKSAYQTQELLNQRLVVLRQIAEEAHQAKAVFVAKISHEFRTPLNIILGLIDTMLEVPEAYGKSLPPLLMQVLEIIQRNSNHLASMISDVLDLSQADAGRLSLHREWADLADDIKNAVVMVVRPLIERKALTLQVSIDDDFPQVYCDRTRIRQVVLNLVSNAARYTETGGIIVKATRQGSDILISVTDTGPGITPQDLDRIFEPFAQADQTRPAQGGSGLGLSVSQQFIERHQGRIWAESKLGFGSTFSFTLPIAPPLPAGGTSAPGLAEDWVWHKRTTWPQLPEMPRKQRIMVCDESGDLAPLLGRHTDEIQFTESRDLPGALEALQTHPTHMLILNAAAPQHLISLMEEARQAIPDMPILGCAFPPKINYALEAGAVDYLIKPIRQPDLAKALNTLDKPVKRILLVDDNPDIRQLYTQMLSIIDPTLEITPTASGAEALAELHHRVRGSEAPDLVLLDILLPDMLGWQVLAEKNQDAAIRDIPVIAISGEELVAWPTRSSVLLATMGAGVPINKLLPCSHRLAALLMKADGELEAG